MGRTVRVAAVQAEPPFLDRARCVAKCVALIEDAAAGGADLIGFPEGFIPTFPNWYESIRDDAMSRDLDKRLFLEALEVPGTDIETLTAACRDNAINAVIGCTERRPGTIGTLFNTQLFVTAGGELAARHQKYVPTVGERLVHAPGGTGTQNSMTTPFGVVSGLICGENANPLAQYATVCAYPVVHVGSWPTYSRQESMPITEEMRTVTSGIAFMLHAYVVSALSRLSEEFIAAVGAATPAVAAYLTRVRDTLPGALIVDYNGRVLQDGSGHPEELIYADIDVDDVIVPKLIHDYAGHYNRPDVFAPLFARYLGATTHDQA